MGSSKKTIVTVGVDAIEAATDRMRRSPVRVFRARLQKCCGARMRVGKRGSQRYTRKMMLKPAIKFIALTFALASFSVPALAQWQWRDKDGNKVFSDRSPPADIREQDILRRPGVRPTQPGPESADTAGAAPVSPDKAAAAAPKSGVPKLPVKDAQLEAKKKAADDEEAAKEKAKDEKIAKAKSENCETAKRYLTTLQSGVRIAGTNAKGEREFMDDGKRAAEKKRTEDMASASCK